MESPRARGIVFSSPERAILELCDEPPDSALVYKADALMQGLATLRPQLVGTLLQHCRSIKAKQLFLALAGRHHHAWLLHVQLQRMELGRGKRVPKHGRGARVSAPPSIPRMSCPSPYFRFVRLQDIPSGDSG